MKQRIVKDQTGQLYIETPSSQWEQRLSAWRANHQAPCPMPVDHKMFKRPAAYGCVQLFAAILP